MGPPPPPGYPYPPQPPQPPANNTGKVIAAVGGVTALLIVLAVSVVLLTGSRDKSAPQLVSRAAAMTATSPATRTVTVEKRTTRSPHSASSAPSVAAVATTHSTTTGSSPGAASAIRSVVQRHWAAIEAGDYDTAYGMLGPALQTGRAGWVADHAKDALESESISLGTPVMTSSTTATVPVSRLRTVASSGCFIWTGSYGMLHTDDGWKINQSNIDRGSC